MLEETAVAENYQRDCLKRKRKKLIDKQRKDNFLMKKASWQHPFREQAAPFCFRVFLFFKEENEPTFSGIGIAIQQSVCV